MNKGRRGLYILAAAGLLSLGVGGGTFATFNAETTNPGNTFSTGSLTLQDNVANTSCFSYGGSSIDNTNSSGCGAIISLNNTGQYAGAPIVAGGVQITNTGTLDAGTSFKVFAPSTSDCADSYGSTVSLTGVSYAAGSTITLPSLPASVVQNSGVSGPGIPQGDTISSISGLTITLLHAATAAASNATLNFSIGLVNVDGTTPALCSAAAIYVESIAQQTKSGTTSQVVQCLTGNCPTTGLLSTGVSSGATAGALALGTGLSATPTVGDHIELMNATGQSQVFTVASATSATAFSVTPISGTTYTANFPAGSAVVDLSVLPTASTPTIASFDTNYATSTNGISISAPSGQSWPDALPAGYSETFQVGLYIPGADTNSLQDLTSTFGLGWYIAQ